MAYSKTFEELGLSPSEAKIYEVLLSDAETGVSDISKRAKVHRRNVYDALNRLLEKGLVFQIFQKGENLYRAVHPNKLLEVLKEKETKLNAILPELARVYETEPLPEAAFIYRGIEGYKNYRRDLLRIGEEVFFLGAKALWMTPGISKRVQEEFRQKFEKEKISYKTIFDPRVPLELPQALENIGGEYRVLPKGFETVGVVDIFGDHIATFTSEGVGNFGEGGSIFVMINRDLAESYKQWFRFIWEHCLPLDKND
ncbi:MAG TPA: helix-turn-helix domain-containing protein [Candidatus Paceibacterota bacterium]